MIEDARGQDRIDTAEFSVELCRIDPNATAIDHDGH
jgi:hypothetical protein